MKNKKHKFRIEQKVRVYNCMNPRRDFKCIAIIRHIDPLHGEGEDMLWFKEEYIRGAWHPDACAEIPHKEIKNKMICPYCGTKQNYDCRNYKIKEASKLRRHSWNCFKCKETFKVIKDTIYTTQRLG